MLADKSLYDVFICINKHLCLLDRAQTVVSAWVFIITRYIKSYDAETNL